MKSLEELALTVSDVSALLPKIILAEVETAARAARFGRQLVRINRDLVGAKGRTINVPVRGTITALDVAEGADLSASTSKVAYSTQEIGVSKVGVGVIISQESIDAVEVDVIRDHIEEAGEALAVKEDTRILSVFLGVSSNRYVNAISAGKLNYEDLVAARGLIIGGNYRPTVAVVHPDQIADLLTDARFIDASKYGSTEVLLQGEIGKLAGLKLLETTQMTAGKVIVCDPTKAAYLVVKRDTDLKRKEAPETDGIQLFFYQEYGCAVTNIGAVSIVMSA